MPFTEINSPDVFKSSSAPYSLGTRTAAGALIHISGQVAQDRQGRNVAVGNARGQAEQILTNMKALLQNEGASLDDVCRIVVYVTSRDFLPAVMEVRKAHFKSPYPATTALVVSGLANPDWLVEIEATAAL